jgi:hypothetical protein
MRPTLLRAGLLAAALSVCSPALAEKVKNPEFEMWSKFKPGAMSKLQGTTEAGGQKSAQTITTKLVEANTEKCVVETTVSMEVGGQKMDMPAQKREVPAMMENVAAPAAPGDAPAPGAKKPDVKTSEETVTVGGKSVKCVVTEMTSEQSGMKIAAKTWTSTDVPGGVVKMESKTTGAMESTTTQELKEFSTGG